MNSQSAIKGKNGWWLVSHLDAAGKSRALITGILVALDLSVLLFAFAVAYLLRFSFQITQPEVRDLFAQIPFVVLLQISALTITGSRASIWRYTGLVHIRSFLYAALGSFFVMALLRLMLPDTHNAWRVPLSVNFIDVALAFGGAFTVRLSRRFTYERTQRRPPVKGYVSGNGANKNQKAKEKRTR